MLTLDALALFVKIAEHGGFTAAAKALGLPKSTVSRRLSDYEERLGITLFQRSTRALSMTDDGVRLYERAKPVIDAALDVSQGIMEDRSSPVGCVVITTTAAIGQHLVAPHLPALMAANPHIQVELRLTERRTNIISDRVDIAIRMGALEDSELVARSLTSISRLTVASPDYLERAGHPDHPNELTKHSCIIVRRDLSVWRFANGMDFPLKWRIAAGNMLVARDLAVSGSGIAVLPRFLVTDDLAAGKLKPVLSDYPLTDAPAWIVATRQKHRSPAVRVVMDHLVSALNRS
jgi:DNA-binding transcriptional LysR family regulator